MKRILSISLCLVLVACVVGLASARTVDSDLVRFTEKPTLDRTDVNTSVRADTVFLFPSSGPGSYGTPGTYERGFTFDGPGGTAETAGWTTYDQTAQDGDWWHIESTTLNAGHATDMSGATPFGGGDNLYSLWCGRTNVCGWDNPNGYGDNWEQSVILDCGEWDTTAQVEFVFRTDYEADDCDYFLVEVEVDEEWVELAKYDVAGPQPLTAADLTALASDYPGQALGDLRLHFRSDGGWSSQTAGFPNDMGPVWVDNVILTVDGNEVGRTDFEDNIQPMWMDFTSPAGAGIYGALYSNLFSEDICIVNTTNAWAFYDPETIDPAYPIPVVVYGPPYVENGIQSPLCDRMHALGDPVGEPLTMGATSQVLLDFWVYRDLPLNALVFFSVYAAAQTEEIPCLGPFKYDYSVTFGETKAWDEWREDMTLLAVESADNGTITGLSFRMNVSDECETWCNVYGDGTGHTPAPYFDNIELKIVDDSAVAWNNDRFRRFQDNFPEENGYVRIDNSDDVARDNADYILPGDSTHVDLNMDLLGGIQTHNDALAGEVRPNLYMYFRVQSGPHQDSTDPMMGDQDATDGIYSPIIGTADFNGYTWNCVVADSSANDGTTTTVGSFAFDFNDEYFQAGDYIRYFYWAEAVDGTVETMPGWALSSDPDLRGYYTIRCLPTAGIEMLYVNDDNWNNEGYQANYWYEAFEYNGYTSFDVYYVQAPSSGLENGLAGRANYDDISQYRTIVWDSGSLGAGTAMTSHTLGDKSADDTLLDEWLNQHDHNASLWLLGNELAAGLTNAVGFLNIDMGVEVLSTDLFYDDYTGILVPKVFATHPNLQYLGDAPEVWVDGGCPGIENFSAIVPTGEFAEVAFEWETTVNDMVAGVINFDPDADGTITSPTGYTNRVLYNPFGYYHVWDAGYGLSVNEDYSRLMVGHVLMNLLGTLPATAPTDVGETPAVTALGRNYPNPFNPTTTIKCSLAEAGPVNLSVYDITGRLVRTLVDNRMDAGEHDIVWNGKNDGGQRVASGVYFYKMTAGNFTETEKMTLLK